MKIRQVVEGARRPHCREIRGVEAEEVNAGFVVHSDVGTNVHLGETGEAGQRRDPAGTHAAHVERNHSDPSHTVVNLQRKLRRNQRTQSFRRDRPVCEQKIVPHLHHDPRFRRQGPGAVCSLAKNWMHKLFSNVWPLLVERSEMKGISVREFAG